MTTIKKINESKAIDVTKWSNEELYQLRKNSDLSLTSYALNEDELLVGAIFTDLNTIKSYKVTERGNALFILL